MLESSGGHVPVDTGHLKRYLCLLRCWRHQGAIYQEMQATEPAFEVNNVTYGPPESSTVLCRGKTVQSLSIGCMWLWLLSVFDCLVLPVFNLLLFFLGSAGVNVGSTWDLFICIFCCHSVQTVSWYNLTLPSLVNILLWPQSWVALFLTVALKMIHFSFQSWVCNCGVAPMYW